MATLPYSGAVAWLRQIFERGVLAQGNSRRDARGALLRAIASARSVRNWTTSGSSRLRTRATRSPRTSSARSPHADAHSIAHDAHLIARPRDLTRCCGLRRSPAVPERDIPGPWPPARRVPTMIPPDAWWGALSAR